MSEWTDIEDKLGLDNLDEIVENEIKPLFRDVQNKAPVNSEPKFKTKLFKLILNTLFFVLLGVGIFILSFLPFGFFLIIIYVLVALIAYALAYIYVIRDEIDASLNKGMFYRSAKTRALKIICQHLDLNYASNPSAKPITFMGKTYSEADINGGDEPNDKSFEKVIKTAHRSGLLTVPSVYLNNRVEAEKFEESLQWFEDGFCGDYLGTSFTSVEWRDKRQVEGPQYHLLLFFKSPYKLSGETQMRTKVARWPGHKISQAEMKPISIGYSSIDEVFEFRGSDQVEARLIFDPLVLERLLDFSPDALFRAAAFEDTLIFDIAGDNQFGIIDLASGEYSDDTIEATLNDIYRMQQLVKAVAHIFSLRA